MKYKHYRKVFWTVFVLTACMFLAYSVKWMTRPTHGFAAYYTSSRMLLEGEDFRLLYNYQTFNNKIHSYGMKEVLDAPNNLPTNALAFLSVAWLPPREAKIAWTIISLILFVLSMFILFRVYDISLREDVGVTLLSVIFLWRPIYDAIAQGQLYFLLLFLFSPVLYGLKKNVGGFHHLHYA
ncbi:MAG: DUF2029 domain-containing protein [Ignavibacteriae bacterium]|nr:DUF2029 domain-containing protein [Ignavibacteriota bacterium]